MKMKMEHDYLLSLDKQLLKFHPNTISDDDIPEILELLDKYPEITRLELFHNTITDKGVLLLATHSTLESLDLGHNPITSVGLKALAPTGLKTLNISNTAIDSAGCSYFLNENKSITHLNIARNAIDDSIIPSVAKHPSLQTFIAHHNKLTGLGFAELNSTKSLTNLDVSFNQITYVLVSEFLKLTPLLSLNISNNPIGDKGFIKLADNKHIQHLQGRTCSASLKGIKNLQKNTNLLSIDVSKNTTEPLHFHHQLIKNKKQHHATLIRQAASTYLGLLLVNQALANEERPYLPLELIDYIADLSNAAVSKSLEIPLPPMAKLKTHSALVSSIGFYFPKEDKKKDETVDKKKSIFSRFGFA